MKRGRKVEEKPKAKMLNRALNQSPGLSKTIPMIESRPKWRMKPRTGVHTMMDGTDVYPGDVIEAYADELEGVLDKFELLGTHNQQDVVEGPPIPEATLKPVHRGFGKWDVVNTLSGEVINTAPLTKVEAHSLVNGEEVNPELLQSTYPEPKPDAPVADEDEDEDEKDPEDRI